MNEAPKRSRRRLAIAVVVVVALFVAGVLAYDFIAMRALKNEIAGAKRDPASGVILGTEAISLGPSAFAKASADESEAKASADKSDAEAACLLLHGFVGSRIDFADLGERLAEAGLYVRMNRFPGHGTTPPDFARQSPEDLIRNAEAELEKLRRDFDRVYVVGFSMGGSVATLLAAERDIDRLVLVSPFYAVTHRWFYALPPAAWNAMLSPFVPYVLKGDRFVQVNRREAVDDLFSYRVVPTRGAATLIELGRRARKPETLQAVDEPVLILQAWGDMAASPEATKRAYQLMGTEEKEIFWYDRNNNHHLFWDYAREDVKRRIVEYLTADSDAAR